MPCKDENKNQHCLKVFRSAATAAVAYAGLGAPLMADCARAEPAISQFEIKSLETEAGHIEFQSQNAHSWGQPRRAIELGDPLEADDNEAVRRRHALEVEVGITDYFRTRVGIEYEQERIDDIDTLDQANAFDDLRLSEFAVEGVLVLIPIRNKPGAGLGMLTEFEFPTDASAPKRWIIGPILEAVSGPWSATFNLTFVHFFGGDAGGDAEFVRDNKWDFVYAAQLKYELSDNLALALEAYGTIDRLGNTGRRTEEAVLFGDFNQHRMGPLIYYTIKPFSGSGAHKGGASSVKGIADDDDGSAGTTLSREEETEVRFGLGLLVGLNDNTPDTTLKWSIEVEY